MLTIDQIRLNQSDKKKKRETLNEKLFYINFSVDYYGPTLIGVDPGVNWGACILGLNHGTVLWGRLSGSKMKTGERGYQAFQLMNELFLPWNQGESKTVVEGAAYNKKFGQVGLEEVRAGIYLGLYMAWLQPNIIPPATIKAKVLGSGRAQAGDCWPWLNHNAADAISIALYAQYI